MKVSYLVVLILIFFYISCDALAQINATCYENINCADFNLINETRDVFLIDVRSQKEYEKNHIYKANSAPNKKSIKLLLKGIDKNEHIYIYCVMGVKSKNISKFVCKELNYSNVYNLEGGITLWKKKGYSVDKSNIIKKKN